MEFSERELQDEMGFGVLQVARSSLDALVQTHAVNILGRYIQCQGVVEFLAQLILDDSRDMDLRHNGLESLRPHRQAPIGLDARRGPAAEQRVPSP